MSAELPPQVARTREGRPATVLEAIAEALWEEMERDGRVFLMGEDIGAYGGAFKVTRGFLEHFGPSRVIDTPISEGGFTGAAAGAAHMGLRPVVEMQFMDFISPAYDVLTNYIATSLYRGAGPLPLVVRGPVGGGNRGGPFHSQNVEAYFFHTPGLKVVAPATPYDAKGLLKSAIRDNNPVVFLEHKKTYRLVRGDVPEEEYVLPIGEAEVKRPGQNITVVSYGLMIHYCLEAAEQLAAEGVAQVEVVDLRTLKPLDTGTILESVKKTGKLLIVHEDNITGGVGSEIAALAADQAFEYLDAPVARVCGPDVPTMPFAQTLEDAYMPNAQKIAEALRNLAAY